MKTKISLAALRSLVREEVYRNYAWSAGLAPGGSSSRAQKSFVQTPPGLGDDGDNEDNPIDGGRGVDQEELPSSIMADKRTGRG